MSEPTGTARTHASRQPAALAEAALREPWDAPLCAHRGSDGGEGHSRRLPKQEELPAGTTMRAGVCLYSAAWEGGSGRFVAELAGALADADLDVTLISPEAVPADREPIHERVQRWYLPQGLSGKGSLARRIATTGARILAAFPALLRARLRTRRVLVTFPDWPSVFLAQLLWLRMLGAEVTWIVHDAKPHAWAFPKPLQWLERAIISACYRLPHRLVTLTRSAKDQLVATFGVAAERVAVIPHGEYVNGRSTPLSGDGVVLVLGWLRSNKRVMESIEGFRRLRERGPTSLKLVVAGAPAKEEPDYVRACRRAAESMKDHVTMEIGFLPEARVAELVARCDALLLPYEEFSSQSGVAVLGCSSERVLISTDAGGIGELVAAGLEVVPVARPVTADSVADALVAFEALDVAQLRMRAARSRDALADHLSWTRIGLEYARLLLHSAT